MEYENGEAPPSKRFWIGGSDIAGVLGVHPTVTPLMTYLKIRGLLPELEAEEREFLDGRKALEPYVVHKLGAKFGVSPAMLNQRYTHPQHSFLKAEIDAEDHGNNYELKTVHPSQSKMWGNDELSDYPIYYAAQVQWGLMIHPQDIGWLVPCIGFDLIKRYPIEPNIDMHEWMLGEAVKFWNDHILAQNPPAPRTISDCLSLFPASVAKAQVATPEVLEHCRKMRELSIVLRNVEGEKERHSTEIRAFLRDADTLVSDGFGIIATYKSNKDSVKTDFEKLAEAYEEKLREFMMSPESFFEQSRASVTSTKQGNRPLLIKLK